MRPLKTMYRIKRGLFLPILSLRNVGRTIPSGYFRRKDRKVESNDTKREMFGNTSRNDPEAGFALNESTRLVAVVRDVPFDRTGLSQGQDLS